MFRHWILGVGFVAVIAGLKTFVVQAFLLGAEPAGLAVLSGLFALFFALTAAVGYFAFAQMRALMVRERKEKLTPGASEPVAKETVILRHARDWGLSQAEADVAIFVAKGFSNTEIAEMRGSAVTTVKSQLGRIYNKSGLESRYQLIAFVTDEVFAMAKSGPATDKVETRNVLPLPGRTRAA